MRLQGDIWEEYYRAGNPPWRGSPLPLPDLPAGSRVLDVGCGTGSTLIQALEMGYTGVGVDLSPTALKIAKSRIRERGFKALLITGDILDADLEPGGYDATLFHHLLSSIVEGKRTAAVEKGIDITREGGFISFQDFSTKDMRYGTGKEIEAGTFVRGNGLTCHFFSMDEVGNMFSGLDPVIIEEVDWPQRTRDGVRRRSRIRALYKKV